MPELSVREKKAIELIALLKILAKPHTFSDKCVIKINTRYLNDSDIIEQLNQQTGITWYPFNPIIGIADYSFDLRHFFKRRGYYETWFFMRENPMILKYKMMLGRTK